MSYKLTDQTTAIKLRAMNNIKNARFNVFDKPVDVVAALTDHILEIAAASIQQHGVFNVALSGGSTPRALYQQLARHKHNADWQQWHFYFGDERFVAADHPDSNYRMARESLLDELAIPPDNIHPILMIDDNPQQTATAYAQTLRQTLPLDAESKPRFDLVLLGLGDDGHTASLFPDTDILEENQQFVAAVYVDKMQSWRISITYPVINHAQHVIVLAVGAGKSAIMKQLRDADTDRKNYPIEAIQTRGEFECFVDQAALGQ